MTQMQTPGYGMQAGMKPHRGVMILVFGILSWCVCFIFGIVAWIMGNTDLREMREGRMDPSGESMTQAGRIIGMIHIILSIIAIPLIILLAVLGAFAGSVAHH